MSDHLTRQDVVNIKFAKLMRDKAMDDYGEQPVLRIAPTFERPSRPIRPAPRDWIAWAQGAGIAAMALAAAAIVAGWW